ncbi:MAG: sugar ABC transporter permease [Elusimicrobia bacterium]|nr:sugar ABC transporter permease [Elusimicrobiota bacterium]
MSLAAERAAAGVAPAVTPDAERPIYWAFALPALVLMGCVNLIPVGQAFYFSSGFGRLWGDARLWATLKNTAVFTFWSVSLELVLGLAMAMALTVPFRGRGWARAAVLIPWALPTAIMAMAWRWIFSADYGVLGDLLFRLGLAASPSIPWLADAGSAMFACVLADVWKTTPFMALLLMSGLATIPDELYEAAGIDGAGPVRRFFIITLPLLKPTIGLAVIFRAIQAFGIFDLVWVLTGGGPGGKTQMVALYVYDTVFRYLDLGYGCALTLVMAACLTLMAALTLLITGFGRKAAR